MASLNRKISQLLKESTVPDSLKDVLSDGLDEFSDKKKSRILKILLRENKKMQGLKRRKERLIEKYRMMMEKVERKD